MNYKMEEKEALKVVGIKRHYKGPEDDESVVGAFWNELYEKGLLKVISDLSTAITKGVHGFIQVLGDEEVNYMIASISDKEPPEGMTSQVIPKSTWAIFELTGPVNSTLETAWKRILPNGFQLPTINMQKQLISNIFHMKDLKEPRIISLRYGFLLFGFKINNTL